MDAEQTRDLFFDIAHCPNVRVCLETIQPHPCRAVVEYQVAQRGAKSYKDFQLPEPWVGQIDVAPILFIGSNPSIGEDDHASGLASDEDIWDSHHLAHGGGRRKYIIDGVRTTAPDGAPLKTVRYWSSIRRRVTELIPDRVVRPGVDYAMSELVHCKSRHEIGVRDALDECVQRYLNRLFTASAARVIIAVGALARRHFLRDAPVPPQPLECVIAGRNRLLAFIPHPSPGPGGPKSLLQRYDATAIRKLRNAVAELE